MIDLQDDEVTDVVVNLVVGVGGVVGIGVVVVVVVVLVVVVAGIFIGVVGTVV